MPAFFIAVGRTFAGGDIMPLRIPWPDAAPARSARLRVVVRTEFAYCFIPRTACFLFRRAAPTTAAGAAIAEDLRVVPRVPRPWVPESYPRESTPPAEPGDRVRRSDPSHDQSEYGLYLCSYRPNRR